MCQDVSTSFVVFAKHVGVKLMKGTAGAYRYKTSEATTMKGTFRPQIIKSFSLSKATLCWDKQLFEDLWGIICDCSKGYSFTSSGQSCAVTLWRSACPSTPVPLYPSSTLYQMTSHVCTGSWTPALGCLAVSPEYQLVKRTPQLNLDFIPIISPCLEQ